MSCAACSSAAPSPTWRSAPRPTATASSGRERAFAMQLAYGTVQRRATLDHLVEQLSGRSVEQLDPPVLAALRLGLYQLVYLEGVADHAAVSESVELAKRRARRAPAGERGAAPRDPRGGGRCWRRSDDATPAEAALRHSHPEWMAELWWRMLGREEARRADGARQRAGRERRAGEHPARHAGGGDRRRSRPRASGRGRDALVPEAVVLDEPYDVHGSALFEQRDADAAVARLDAGRTRARRRMPGESVLDLCAAPGAKTTQIAALMRDERLDRRRRPRPAPRAGDRRTTAGGSGSRSSRLAPATRRGPSSGSGYDRVLVDPPCSDLGTLQSRPDVRWRKQPAQVEDLAALQATHPRGGSRSRQARWAARLLDLHHQRAGEPAADRRLSRPPAAISPPIDLSAPYPDLVGRDGGGFLQTLPHRDGTDGFFIAALERTAG